MKTFEVKDHAPSILPKGDWKLVWSDEFDGDTLDTTKWDYRLSMMGKRHPAWTDKGVKIENGCAVFTAMEEDGRIVSSQLQTGYNFMDEPTVKTTFCNDSLQWNIGKLKENKYTKCHGYFECRARLQQRKGWWSAFWIQSPIIGASLDPSYTGSEIDVMESFKPGEIKPHNVFTGGYGLDSKRTKVGGNLNVSTDDFHLFGVLWDEKGYTFYIDGVEDGHIDADVSNCPEFILISTEVNGYRKEARMPTEEAYGAVGDTFLVDHVRVFDVVKEK